MTIKNELAPTWDEQPDALIVVFPPVHKSPPGRGCAWVMLLMTSFLVPLVPLCLAMALSGGIDASDWRMLIWMMGEVVALALWWRCYRDVRRPPKPQPEPRSVLAVRDDVLKIERAGRAGDLDVSWDLSEIADLRLCRTHSLLTTLGYALHPSSLFVKPDLSLIEVVVTLPSGKLESVIVPSRGEDWMPELETELRRYLGLAPDQVPT